MIGTGNIEFLKLATSYKIFIQLFKNAFRFNHSFHANYKTWEVIKLYLFFRMVAFTKIIRFHSTFFLVPNSRDVLLQKLAK